MTWGTKNSEIWEIEKYWKIWWNRKLLKVMGKYKNIEIERYGEIEKYWKIWGNIRVLKDMGKYKNIERYGEI